MTPAQMLQKRVPESECCSAVLPVSGFDFASSAGLSTYACVKQRTCPVCGNKGTLSNVYGGLLSFFYCSTDKGHTFEINEQTSQVDRIGS